MAGICHRYHECWRLSQPHWRWAGTEGLRFPELRHEATTRLFERGLNIMEVASIIEHRNLRMLHRYMHLKAEELAQKLG